MKETPYTAPERRVALAGTIIGYVAGKEVVDILNHQDTADIINSQIDGLQAHSTPENAARIQKLETQKPQPISWLAEDGVETGFILTGTILAVGLAKGCKKLGRAVTKFTSLPGEA